MRPLGVLAAVAFSAAVNAATPEVERGLAWLAQQPRADGSIAAEGASIAFPLQVRTETHATLRQLASAPTPLAELIARDESTAVEMLARKAAALAPAGRDVAGVLAALAQRQNADGGFGGASGYRSNPLDTALALRAFKAAGQSQSTLIGNAIAYLQSTQAADGSFPFGDPDSVHSSAEALQALSAFASSYPATSAVGAARTWLASRQVQGSYGPAFENAVAILALIASSVDATPLILPVAALKGGQSADGSWDGDPYVTALALRALAAAAEILPPSTTGQVSGTVAELASGEAIAGAQVLVSGPQAATLLTDGNGAFASQGLDPGTYSIQVSKAGYASASASATVSAGVTTLLGTIRLAVASTTAIVRGTVRDGVTGQTLTGATVAIVGGASAQTDADGRYEIAGILPGSISLTVSMAGYQTVSASATVAGGLAYTLSPSLYPPGQGADTSIKGKVVDRATAGPIAGAAIRAGTLTAASSATGDFQLEGLAAGAISIEITAAGYSTYTLSGTIAPGVNDLGVLQLDRQQAPTATVSGRVFDNANNLPVGGATVRVLSNTLATATNSNGNYAIAGITQPAYTIEVSAAGFATRAVSVSGTAIADAVVDVGLDKLATGALSLRSVSTNLPAYAPFSAVEIELEVLNSAETPADVLFEALVFDAADTQVLAAPAFQVTVPSTASGAPFEIELETHTGSLAPGTYRVVARGSDGNGVVMVEGSTSFQILSVAKLGGGVAVDPPIAQAGTSQPVRLTASLANHGNNPIPAGKIEVLVSLVTPDAQSASLPRFELLPGVIAGAPLSEPIGAGLDAQGNLYVVNKSDRRVLKIGPAPDNTITVLATIPATLPKGTSFLQVFVRDAVADAAGNVYVLNHREEIFRIDASGALSRITTGLTGDQSVFDRDPAGNFFYVVDAIGNVNRISRVPTSGPPTTFPSNGLTNPRGIARLADGYYYITNMSENSISRMSADGTLVPWVTSGLLSPMGVTADAQGNLYVANNGGNNVVKIVPKPDGTGGVVVTPAYATGFTANGFNQPPTDVELDPATGAMYVSTSAEIAVFKVAAGGGTAQPWARTLIASPQGLAYDATGILYAASGSSVNRKDLADNVERAYFGLVNGRSLAVNSAGTAFATSGGTGAIVRIVGNTGTSWATGLLTPYGATLDGAGTLYVTESAGSANRIASYNSFDAASPAKTLVAESVITTARDVRVAPNGDRLVLNADSIGRLPQAAKATFDVKGAAAFTANATSFHLLGSEILVQEPNAIRKVAGGVTTLVKDQLPTLARGIAADNSGAALVAVATGNATFPARSVLAVTSAGAVSILATLPDAPAVLIEDGAGGAYVGMTTGHIARVLADGTVGMVTTVALSPVPTRLALDSVGGKLYILGSTAGLRAFNLADRTVTTVGALAQTFDAITFAAGELHVLKAATRELHAVSLLGAVTRFAAGFSTPEPIVWTGSQLIFSDATSTFALTPGGHPTLLLNERFGHLAWNGSTLYGTRGDANVYAFTPGVDTASRVYLTPRTGARMQGLAFRPADGALTVASSLDGSAWTYDAARQVVASYAGIAQPLGMAIDAQGILHVASTNSGQIVRVAAAGKQSTPFASVIANGLAFDASGQLLATSTNKVLRVAADGSFTTLATGGTSLHGITAAGGTIVVADGPQHMIRKVEGDQAVPLAVGISSPRALRIDSTGAPIVASNGTGSLLRLVDGRLTLRAVGIPAPTSLAFSPTGATLVGTAAGEFHAVDAAGTVTEIGDLTSLYASVNGASAFGSTSMAIAPDGTIHSVAQFRNQVDRLAYTPAGSGPQPGPVGMLGPFDHGDIALGATLADIDLGTWLPPYAGDFEFRVRPAASTLAGDLRNVLHVGPHATARITTAQQLVAPGNTTVSVGMTVNGADFESVARPDPRGITVAVPELFGFFFRAMTADSAGAIYVTNGIQNIVWKYTAAGGLQEWFKPAATFGSMTLQGQIPIDNEQALYVNGGATGSRVYRVGPFGLDGAIEAVEIGDVGESIRSMTRASDDSIYALTATTIHRLARTGPSTWARSALATGTLGQFGAHITVDGRDNLYTYGNNVLTAFRADGTRMNLLRPNPFEPSFEGEGFPLAGDCAGNMLVAPYNWAEVGQSGEEYTLVQVSGRTGKVMHVFDGRKTYPVLNDMDSFAFDRFSSSLLSWTDAFRGRIHRLPLTCGAIDTDLHLVVPASQPASGFSVTPNATIARPDGSREYVWRFRDVTNAGKAVTLQTTLPNLQFGETRAVASEAYLTFRNSFVTGEVRVPVTVPMVTADGMIDLTLGIDSGVQFPANADVNGTISLRNRDAASARTGTLQVEITDSRGERVVSLGEQAVSIGPDATVPYSATFNTGTFLAGAYAMKATLSSPTGAPLAVKSVDFYIVSPADVLIPGVSTDRRVYEANDTVRILGRTRNVSLNTIATGHTLTVKVRNRLGQEVFNATDRIDLLVPQALKTSTFALNLSSALDGAYEVEAILMHGATRVGEPVLADFSVLSTPDTGTGLAGAVTATREVDLGDSATITATLRNLGNGDLASVGVRIEVLDPSSGQVVAAFDEPGIALAAGTSRDVVKAWNTTGAAPATYVAVATATVNQRVIALGQDSIRVVADITPDAFSFPPRADVTAASLVVSDPVLITGVSAPVQVSVTGGEYSIDGVNWTAASQSIPNNTTVRVRVLSSATAGGTATVVLTVSGVSAGFTVTTTVEDRSPDPFAFAPLAGVVPGSAPASNEVTISGINVPVSISIAPVGAPTDAAFSINGAPYSSTPAQVVAGDRVRVRQTASVAFNATTTVTLTVGDFDAAFAVTTQPLDALPDAFAFTAQGDVPLASVRTSNTVTLAGINTRVPVSITGGEYSVNGGAYTAAAGEVAAGDQVTVRLVSASAFATTTTATLNVSGVTAAFSVTTTGIAQVTLSLGFNADSRVLVLLSCRNSQGGSDPACLEQRRVFLDALLTSLGITHLITTDSEPFRVAMRSGLYNTYWVSGGAEKLKDTLVEEAREAAFRGESLIADGFHDDRNHFIDEVFGVSYGGNVSPAPATVVLTGANVPQGSFTFTGDSIKANLVTGTREASFDTAGGSPAIVSNTYGSGRGVLYAFDLVGTLMAQAGSALVTATLVQSVEYAQPSTGQAVSGGGYAPFALEIANGDPAAVDLEVVATLPGFTFLSSTPAPAAPGEARWNLVVPAEGSAMLDWAYAAPETAGIYAGSVTVSQVLGAEKRVIQASPITVEVRTVASLLPVAISELQALTLAVTAERQARDRALTSLQQAQTAIGQAQNAAAIPLLIDAVNQIAAVESVSTAAQQAAIDWVLHEVSGRWYRALPPCPATPHCR